MVYTYDYRSVKVRRQACTLAEAAACMQAGLGIAVEYILKLGIDNIWERVHLLASLLRQQLSALDGATVQDRGRLLCGIVSFTLVSYTCLLRKSSVLVGGQHC